MPAASSPSRQRDRRGGDDRPAVGRQGREECDGAVDRHHALHIDLAALGLAPSARGSTPGRFSAVIVSMPRLPCIVGRKASTSSPCLRAQLPHTRSVAAIELISVPSMSNRKASKVWPKVGKVCVSTSRPSTIKDCMRRDGAVRTGYRPPAAEATLSRSRSITSVLWTVHSIPGYWRSPEMAIMFLYKSAPDMEHKGASRPRSGQGVLRCSSDPFFCSPSP